MLRGDARLYLTNILFTYFCSSWWYPTCHITPSLTGQPWITGDSWSGFKCKRIKLLLWSDYAAQRTKLWISNHYKYRENKNVKLLWVINNYYLDALHIQVQKRPHSLIYGAAMQHQSISDLGKGQGNDKPLVPALQAVAWHGERDGSQGQMCPSMVFPMSLPTWP